MSASGCASKCVASSASRSAIWRLSSAMIPIAARVLAPNAAVTAAGAASCGVREHFLNLQRSGVEVALAPSNFECQRIFARLRRPASRGSGATQDGQRVPAGQILERLQRRPGDAARSAERRPLVWRCAPRSDSDEPGQHLDRLGIGCRRQSAMVVTVGAHQIANDLRRRDDCARDVVAVAVAATASGYRYVKVSHRAVLSGRSGPHAQASNA